MAIVGRLLEAQGFRVGIIAQPDWHSAAPFAALGRPRAVLRRHRRQHGFDGQPLHLRPALRSDDAYTPNGEGGKRPDRAVIVYAQRCREAFGDVPIIIGGIEASLRRIAHYDYWSEKVRRSVLLDAKADLLVYGNAERAIVEIAHRLAQRQAIATIRDMRGTAFLRPALPPASGSRSIRPHRRSPGPLESAGRSLRDGATGGSPARTMARAGRRRRRGRRRGGALRRAAAQGADRERSVIRMPATSRWRDPCSMRTPRASCTRGEPGQRARAGAAPRRARRVAQPAADAADDRRDGRACTSCRTQRVPHPSTAAKIPAYEMIRFSVTIQRGCFGGCTFCSITEHEGRIIQNRSRSRSCARSRSSATHAGLHRRDFRPGRPDGQHVPAGLQEPRDRGGVPPPSCVYPGVCPNLNTDHSPLIELYRKARSLPGIKKVLIASGVRYDLAVEVAGVREGAGPAPCRRLPEDRARAHRARPAVEDDEAGHRHLLQVQGAVRQVLEGGGQGAVPDPVLHRRAPGHHRRGHAEPGAVAEEANGFRADQVQAFLPSPMATATAMYHTGLNPLRGSPQRGR
jgi:uncharacterized radical SAM protein YgiQ